MDMVGLKYFISAAKQLNFTKAADECCITQTAMSLHIAKIEKELGFKLFNRNRRSVSLTPGGAVFLREAEKILRQYTEAVQRSGSAAVGHEGVLRLGFTNFIERAFFPELIGRFHTLYPRIEIVLNKNEQPSLIQDLKQGLNDVSVVFPYNVEDDDEICVETFCSYDICAVVGQDHPFSGKGEISLTELQNDPVIISTGTKLPMVHKRMHRDWLNNHFSPDKVIEADSADAMLFLVEAGFGSALMPSCVRQVQNEKLKVLDLKGAPFKIDMAVAYIRESENPALELFLTALKEYLKE